MASTTHNRNATRLSRSGASNVNLAALNSGPKLSRPQYENTQQQHQNSHESFQPSQPHHIPISNRLPPFPLLSNQADHEPTTGHWSTSSWSERWRYLSYYYLPISSWLPKYNIQRDLGKDIAAGLSVGAVLIPQSMAYASILHLDPIHGLITALFAGMVYFVFGRSSFLSVGPQGATSMLLAESCMAIPIVKSYKEAGHEIPPSLMLSIACAITFLAGVVTLVFGLFRLGFVDGVFSRPVLSGLICGVGMQLLTDQMPKILGIPSCKTCSHSLQKLTWIWDQVVVVKNTNFYTLGVGICCVSFLFFYKSFKAKHKSNQLIQQFPNIFAMVIVVTLCSYLFDFNGSYGITTIGSPAHVPKSSSPAPPPAPFIPGPTVSHPGATNEGPLDRTIEIFILNFKFPQLFFQNNFGLYFSHAIILAVLTFVETQLVNKTITSAQAAQQQAHNSSTQPHSAVGKAMTPKAGVNHLLDEDENENENRQIGEDLNGQEQLPPAENFQSDDAVTSAGISPNRELIALGLMHMTTAMFAGYIACGSLARTRVAFQSGAKTQITNATVMLLVIITILFCMPFFAYLPHVVSSSIVFFVATGLLEVHELIFTYNTKQWVDFGLNFVLIFLTYLAGIDIALAFAFAICLLLVIKQQNTPSVRLLSKFDRRMNRQSLLDLVDHQQLQQNQQPQNQQSTSPFDSSLNSDLQFTEFKESYPLIDVVRSGDGILIYQIDGVLFFCNAENLKERLRRIENSGTLAAHPSEHPTQLTPYLNGIIFDLQSVTTIDATAAAVMMEIIQGYHAEGIPVVLVKLRKSLLPLFIDSHITDLIGMNCFKSTIQGGIDYIHQFQAEQSQKQREKQRLKQEKRLQKRLKQQSNVRSQSTTRHRNDPSSISTDQTDDYGDEFYFQ